MGAETIRVRLLGPVTNCPAEIWDACAEPGLAAGGCPQDPFVMHAFLCALEESGSVAPECGWAPCHLLAETESGKPLGVLPLYAKSHSMGEFVFDHAWADAFERSGGRYYPKLQVSIPFTPVTGRRFLLQATDSDTQDRVAGGLLAAAQEIARQHKCSSVHIAFCTGDEWKRGGRVGLLRRQGWQFHWRNRDPGYDSFDDFLQALSARKRKQIRRERAELGRRGLVLDTLRGDDIRPEHWDVFWRFYTDTGSRKWGMPYLTRPFFDLVHARMGEQVVLFLARNAESEPVAGALNFLGRDALFGRYWGRTLEVPFLHFELCYYQAIDYAIRNRLARVEAGAGGDHKAARGYVPVRTQSLHWIADPALRSGVARFLQEERAWVGAETEWLAAHGAYRRNGTEEAGG